MALDRQRILNELGSVMNQLQSADCGCMGKLFRDPEQDSAPRQVGSPLPTCGGCIRNRCCGHGHRWNPNASCGEPYQGNTPNTYTPCMARCNPPKLYADSYNYLTHNLMQPTVREVYDDLKSLTPENTIANNPMANQMGLSANGLVAHSNEISEMSKVHNMNDSNIGNISAGNPYNHLIGQTANVASTHQTNPNQIGELGGMGPQIMSMVGGNPQNQKRSNIGPNGQLTESILIDAPQSPHGQIGVMPVRTNKDLYNTNLHGYSGGYNANQTMVQQNMEHNIANNTGIRGPAAQQMVEGHRHGHHSQGVAKFNEIFPGVMKNMGGDLGFDPMAIAIQMNPANQQQAAMNTMNKIMQKNDLNKVFDQSANPGLLAQKEPQQNQILNNIPSNQVHQSYPPQQNGNTVQQNAMPTNQMAYQNAANVSYPNEQLNTTQVYAVKPVPNQITSLSVHQQHEHQNINDPKTGAAYEETPGPPALIQEPHNVPKIIQEPILPADNSRYIAKQTKHSEFNTLGQPIEKFSAKMYRTPEPSLPQTLSPQNISKHETNIAKYSNVKSTVSKTSLMGAKVGRTPSQLQTIYNQYKGSQSFTQQNIGASGVNGASHSEGKLNATTLSSNQQRQIPVEKIGGDTLVNNRVSDERAVKVEQVIGQIGDVPAAVKATGDGKQDQIAPVFKRNTRNGLQDIVYTSYPPSAWTFHGARPRPNSPVSRTYGR
ncbi:uncharacterized protein LOC112050651 [Bicyclus anynana]|uniref:Uncharacterized protein LOC112050651 n=1 Tax=Bicyclus anynana TaxID=110368 RepID=A0A6J1NNH3_BICAN|nr:uncharacterized protein LOC112050651 [Bicyclus anynana]